MNRTERTTNPTAARRLCVSVAMLATVATFGALPASAAEDAAQSSLEQWLLRRLNDPTPRELAHERKGNVYIYDGLTDREVDRALSTHFDRIEYMMFLGTRRTDPTGEELSNAAGAIETESPGCGGP